MDDGEDVDTGIVLPSEDLDHGRGGHRVGRIPSGEFGHDDIARFGFREGAEETEGSREAAVIGHHRGPSSLAVESSDDAGAATLDDPDDFRVGFNPGRDGGVPLSAGAASAA